MSVHEAQTHEDNADHVRRVRRINGDFQASDPYDFAEENVGSGGARSSAGSSQESSPIYTFTGLPEVHDIEDEYTDDEFTAYLGPRPTVRGPALDGDPADQIFDDFGGFLAARKPMFSVDEETETIIDVDGLGEDWGDALDLASGDEDDGDAVNDLPRKFCLFD